jgi:hypothetical protein
VSWLTLRPISRRLAPRPPDRYEPDRNRRQSQPCALFGRAGASTLGSQKSSVDLEASGGVMLIAGAAHGDVRVRVRGAAVHRG